MFTRPEHHQGFNSSIGTYHKIQSSISSSQNRVRNLRNSLEDAKSGLLSTKPELKGLATSSQKYDDIIQLFSQIQEIQSLPEKLELHISDKRFLAAVHVLHDAFRLLRRSDLENIGALADIRAYFSNQETSLTDILIEELHDHLYLKSPYCSDRWKPPVSDSDNTGSVNPAVSVANGSTWERPIYSFLARLDASSPMVEDGSRNPEADTFYYIQLLIEALNKMGNLDVAVDRIEQRLPVELFAVVDKTNAEVDAHYPNLSRTLASHDVKAELPAQNIELHGHVLSEFLWALYAKFESIAEGHRVVHDVIAGIVERESISKSSKLVGGFKEMWKLYQSEVRTDRRRLNWSLTEFSHCSARFALSCTTICPRTARQLSTRDTRRPRLDVIFNSATGTRTECVPGISILSERPLTGCRKCSNCLK